MHERQFVSFSLIERSGFVLAARHPEECGERVSTRRVLIYLDDAFEGRTVFVRPLYEIDRLPGLSKPRIAEPLVWFMTPVRDLQDRVIALLGFAERAGAEFSTLLRPPGLGATDEIYLFDEQGLLLSDSRHAELLRWAGVLKDPDSKHSMLQVELRDPGRDLLHSRVGADESGSHPFTRLVATAVASRYADGSEQQRGVLLEPYRNYLGSEVVGAWRWLPAYELGAALEIGVGEAYGPVQALQRAFTVVLGLSIAAAIAIVMSLLTTAQIRLRLRNVRRVGRYTLVRQIGEGGMASVYLGRHALLKRPIAIKILKREFASEQWITRFEREVQLASQLSHPNTVEIYDYGRTRGGDFYYVMEYLDGIDLASLIASEGALPPARVIYLLRQMCVALREAHAKNIVHRDIKPENVMTCMRGGEYDVVKLLDFGLVKSLADHVSRDITRQVRVLGTPAYMAPERFTDAGAADQRADIYALGAVAYLLLTGKRIFADASGEDLQLRILHAPVPAPSTLGLAELPPALEELIMRCLAKKPSDRPASVDELLVTLEQVALSHPWSQAQARAWWQEFAAREQATAAA